MFYYSKIKGRYLCFCRQENVDQTGNEDEANADEKRVISYEVIIFIYYVRIEETILMINVHRQ